MDFFSNKKTFDDCKILAKIDYVPKNRLIKNHLQYDAE